jgi:hypothetical protein
MYISHSAKLQFQTTSDRNLSSEGLTVQDTGVLDFLSTPDVEFDAYEWIVYKDYGEGARNGLFHVEAGGLVTAHRLQVIAVDMTVDKTGTINADKRGFQNGPGKPSATNSGASYGGRGGYYSGANVADSYGSLVNPIRFGSGLGSGLRGGGHLRFVVSNKLWNEGLISCNGVSSSSGGGSGGSVFIKANFLEGFGGVQAMGGSGTSSRGGGSGGRISIWYRRNEFWFGDVRAWGGLGGTGRNGGAGTIYYNDDNQGVTNRTLVIDAGNRDAAGSDMVANYGSIASDSGRTWLPVEDSSYTFEILRVVRKGEIAMLPAMQQPNGLHASKIEGDRTGIIHSGID